MVKQTEIGSKNRIHRLGVLIIIAELKKDSLYDLFIHLYGFMKIRSPALFFGYADLTSLA